jgi:hypothetical protein
MNEFAIFWGKYSYAIIIPATYYMLPAFWKAKGNACEFRE